MSQNKKADEESDDILNPNRFIQDTFWILPLFNIIRGIEEFTDYVGKEAANSRSTFRGYRLLVRRLLDSYLDDLQGDSFLGLTEDKKTVRAFFVGLPPDKIPPTSEKANLLKNLRTELQKIATSKDYGMLRTNLESLDRLFMSPLGKIFEINVEVEAKLSSRIEKGMLLDYVGADFLWLHAQDIDRIVPLRSSEFEEEELADPRVSSWRKKLDYDFEGYKLGLAFLWQKLLPEKSTEYVPRLRKAKTWEELSEISNGMRDILFEIDKETGQDSLLAVLFTKKGVPEKTLFTQVIHTAPAPELSLHEKIEETLLWYQFDIIDSARSKIFTGSSTFTSLLRGEVAERRDHDIKDKLEVIRFKHPAAPGDVPTFSYGLLMERFGSISDFSGWLLFMEVGGDYAGLGGTEYYRTEQYLKVLGKYVNVTELEISLRDLRTFFLDKIKQKRKDVLDTSMTETEAMRFKLDDLNTRMSKALGRLLEFVARSFYEEQGYDDVRIRFMDAQILPNKYEIDVLAISKLKREAVVIECSTNVPIDNIDDFITEINIKTDSLARSTLWPGFSFRKVFVTTDYNISQMRISSSLRDKFNLSGVEMVSIEGEIIPGLQKRFDRDELLEVFGLPKGVYSELFDEDYIAEEGFGEEG